MSCTGRRVLGRSLLAGLLAGALASPAAAADVGPLRPGDRIRYTTRPGGDDLKEAVVVELTGTTLTVDRADAAKVRLPVAALTKLEVARGKRAPIVEGILLGAAAGAILFRDSGSRSSPDGPQPNFEPAAGFFAGAAIGAALGAVFKVDRWKEVSGHELRVSAGPRPGGFGAQVSLRF